MPVEVLCFHVEGEHICQKNIESAGYFPDTLDFQVRRALQGRSPEHLGRLNVHRSCLHGLREGSGIQLPKLSLSTDIDDLRIPIHRTRVCSAGFRYQKR